MLSAALIWQGSHSAFTATTSNAANSFTSGTVTLTDDDSGTAMFTATGLAPGSTGTKCIKVTYGGSVAAAIKMYVASGDVTFTGTSLAPYLNLTVEEDTAPSSTGAFAGCGNFAVTNTHATAQTLTAFAAARTNFGSGVGSLTPTGSAPQSTVYRFTYTVADNNAAQNANVTVKFTFEAQNT